MRSCQCQEKIQLQTLGMLRHLSQSTKLLQLTNIEVDCDVIVNANPVYHSNVKIEANAAYH